MVFGLMRVSLRIIKKRISQIFSRASLAKKDANFQR
jgi:hypothetical protein